MVRNIIFFVLILLIVNIQFVNIQTVGTLCFSADEKNE